MQQICLHCKKIFDAKKKTAKYCSNACRVYAHRERNHIPEPNFLKNDITKVGSLSGNIQNEKVIKKKLNPEWVLMNSNLKEFEGEKERLENEKSDKIKRLSKLSDKYGLIVIGGLGGSSIGSGIGIILADEEKKGLGALAGGLIGLGVGLLASSYFQSQLTESQKEKLNALSSEISDLDKRLNSILVEIETSKLRLEKTPKALKIDVEPQKKQTVINVPIGGFRATEAVLSGNKEQPLQNYNIRSSSVITSNELSKKEYQTWNFKDEYLDFFGSPEYGFSCAIFGISGNGKSTFALNFAGYLSKNHGKVLYISSEEGQRMTMQTKIIKLNLQSDSLIIAECNNKNQLSELIKNNLTPFIIIDSINHLGISADELEKLKNEYKTRSFICIMQATKDGDYKGGTAYKHNTDIFIEVFDMVATTEKNRFNETGKTMKIGINN